MSWNGSSGVAMPKEPSKTPSPKRGVYAGLFVALGVAAVTIYIGNFLNPSNLAFQCQIRYPDFPRFSLLGLCAFGIASYFIVTTTYRSIKERRLPVGNYWSGVAIFLFSLAPFLGISPFGSHAFADRFTLLPTLGLSIAGCSMMMAFVSSLKSASKFVVCLSQFGVLAILAGITFRQCTYWENERTLFERTIQVDGPTNGNANDELVQYYYEFPHDYQKICRHGKDLMRSPDWQQLVSSTLGPILVEAAYEIGDTELANDFDSWQYREGPPSCVLPVRRFVGKEVAINFSLERRIGLGRPIGTNGRQPRNRTSSPNYRHNCTSCSTDKVEHARKTRLDIFIIHD